MAAPLETTVMMEIGLGTNHHLHRGGLSMKPYHNEKCIEDRKKYDIVMAEFEGQYPNYCRSCRGWGMHSCPDTRYEPGGIDPCSCIEQGDCPRCGEHVWNEDDFDGSPVKCPSCGWDEDNPEAAPEPPDCLCYLEEEARWERERDADPPEESLPEGMTTEEYVHWLTNTDRYDR